MRTYTGPTDISLIDGRMHVEGYPDAERVGALETPMARRLADLRLHESALMFSEQAMQEFGLMAERPLAREAILVGVVAKYFSCFGDNKAAASLSADRVFKNMPDAKRCFEYWKALRDKHLIHNESAISHMVTGVVFGPRAEVQDILSLQMLPALDLDHEHCQLLYNLIDHTLKFVRDEIANLLPRIFKETNDMTIAERLILKDVVYTVPGSDAAFATRSPNRS